MGEKMTLHDRVEFALRDAGFDLDEASRIATLAESHITQPAQEVDALELLASEYERAGIWPVANGLRANGIGNNAFDYEVAIRAIKRAITAPQAVDVGAIASRLRVASDAAYCDYIRQLRETECLGWESKVSSGKFGCAELDAHNRAHELLGRHRALSEAVAILTTAALTNANGKEDCQHEWEQVTERGKFCVHCGQIITHATFEYVPPQEDTPDAAR